MTSETSKTSETSVPASVLLHLPAGTALFDPGPAATEQRGLRVVDAWDDSVIGVVGWSLGGLDALRTAVTRSDLERLVLVSTPCPDELPDDLDLDGITAKTLLLFGSADPQTGSRHGRAWKKRLPNARLEMVPKGGHDLLEAMWHRITSHVAPGRSGP